jgi:hypothetical protein
MMRCWKRALHRGKEEADRRPRLTIDYTKSAASS